MKLSCILLQLNNSHSNRLEFRRIRDHLEEDCFITNIVQNSWHMTRMKSRLLRFLVRFIFLLSLSPDSASPYCLHQEGPPCRQHRASYSNFISTHKTCFVLCQVSRVIPHRSQSSLYLSIKVHLVRSSEGAIH